MRAGIRLKPACLAAILALGTSIGVSGCGGDAVDKLEAMDSLASAQCAVIYPGAPSSGRINLKKEVFPKQADNYFENTEGFNPDEFTARWLEWKRGQDPACEFRFCVTVRSGSGSTFEDKCSPWRATSS